MKKIITLLLCVLLVVSALTGCTSTANLTDKIAPETPTVLTPCSDFSAAQNFALELFRQTLTNEEENPIISPASAYLCLAMAMNGADTQTLQEFSELLGGDLSTVNSLSYALYKKLIDTKENTTLHIANSLWADDNSISVNESYIQNVVNYFDAEIYSADIPSQAALDAINCWVNEKTNGLIPTLRETPYDESTVLVLLNTLYMKTKWLREFYGWQTHDDTFIKADETEVLVPFMHAYEQEQQYIHSDAVEGVILPYDDQKTAFIALRPTNGQTAREFADALTAEEFTTFMETAQETRIDLSMPKFDLSYAFSLNDILKNMGLISAFNADADLSKIGTSQNGPLFISSVFQKVKIEVNEQGTEAAAVTEITADAGASLPIEPPIALNLDSPFLYAVIDVETGMPLFMGLLEDPSVQS